MSKAFISKCCGKAVTISSFINACEYSYPEEKWLSYCCPSCNEHFVLSIQSEVVRFGELVGGPGPVFESKFTHRIPNLQLIYSPHSLTLSFENTSQEIKKR